MSTCEAAPSSDTWPAATVVRLSGDIDIFTSKAMRTRLVDALGSSHELLVLDLSDLEFCDSSGLGVLVGVQRRARSMGITLALTAPTPHMSRLLHVTGLDRCLPRAV